MPFKLFPYKRGSKSAKLLALSLGIRRIDASYNPYRTDVIINWGNSIAPRFPIADHDLNKHGAIALACNKLKTFKALSDADFEAIPKWTTSQEEASQWNKVYCRTLLTGHSGHGIIISEGQALPYAPLYTKALNHKYEFRVHVFRDKILDIQQKKKRLGSPIINQGIRNFRNGWVFCRDALAPFPQEMLEACKKAVNVLGLDFAACDVGLRERDGKYAIFEINTAPGIEGTTLLSYARAFRGI